MAVVRSTHPVEKLEYFDGIGESDFSIDSYFEASPPLYTHGNATREQPKHLSDVELTVLLLLLLYRCRCCCSQRSTS